MINLEYHKGQPCVNKPLMCQEGICSGCMINLGQSSPMIPLILGENKQFLFNRTVYKKQLLKA
jgi:hypothetical protein